MGIFRLRSRTSRPCRRFFALLDTGEALIKYSAGIAFSCVAAASRQAAERATLLYNTAPTLGTIASQMREILDAPEFTPWPLDLVRPVFKRPNGKVTPTARYLLDEFISLRNSQRGHGAQ